MKRFVKAVFTGIGWVFLVDTLYDGLMSKKFEWERKAWEDGFNKGWDGAENLYAKDPILYEHLRSKHI